MCSFNSPSIIKKLIVHSRIFTQLFERIICGIFPFRNLFWLFFIILVDMTNFIRYLLFYCLFIPKYLLVVRFNQLLHTFIEDWIVFDLRDWSWFQSDGLINILLIEIQRIIFCLQCVVKILFMVLWILHQFFHTLVEGTYLLRMFGKSIQYHAKSSTLKLWFQRILFKELTVQFGRLWRVHKIALSCWRIRFRLSSEVHLYRFVYLSSHSVSTLIITSEISL